MIRRFLKSLFGSGWKGVLGRILLGIVLFLLVTLIHAAAWRIMDYRATGWPFHFAESWGPCPPGQTCHSENNLALTADLLFWYLAVCLIAGVLGRLPAESRLPQE